MADIRVPAAVLTTLHHLCVALAASGLSAHVHRFPSADDRRHLATVRVRAGTAETGFADLRRAIEEHRTDRRPLGSEPVSRRAIDLLTACVTRYGATLHPVTEPAARRRLDAVLADAGARQRFAPGYAAELTIWSHRWAAARDGVPAGSRTTRSSGPDLRGFPRGTLGDARPPSPAGEHDASVLFALATTGDEPLHHLLAGEATSAVLLTATARRLATTPLSQAQEVASTRARLASSVLRSPDHPQLVIRVGHPAPGARPIERTPRRTLDEVLMH